MEDGTWHIVELLSGRTPVELHWVFHIKRTADGSIERHEAPEGYEQYSNNGRLLYFPILIRLRLALGCWLC